VRWILVVAAAYVLSLNWFVRQHGGDAHPLSVVRLPEKTHAVLKLGTHMLKHVWSDHCDRPAAIVAEAARAEGIPVGFALAIARTESNFRPHSISSTGAMGLMQLMPQTARAHGVSDPFDPEDNARGAMAFIDTLWKRYRGDRLRVAAAYNAGPGRVSRSGKLRIPSETRAYSARVVKRAREPVERQLRNPLEVARK
jgi:hypothetical protein